MTHYRLSVAGEASVRYKYAVSGAAAQVKPAAEF
jgi:hypothetical protein